RAKRTCAAVALMLGFAALPATAQALAWSPPVLIDPPPALTNTANISGISCARTRLCVAIDASGHIFSSLSPGGGLGAWRLVSLNRGRAGGDLTGVACPGSRLCVVVNHAGEVLAS